MRAPLLGAIVYGKLSYAKVIEGILSQPSLSQPSKFIIAILLIVVIIAILLIVVIIAILLIVVIIAILLIVVIIAILLIVVIITILLIVVIIAIWRYLRIPLYRCAHRTISRHSKFIKTNESSSNYISYSFFLIKKTYKTTYKFIIINAHCSLRAKPAKNNKSN